jgi:hypothetical protein
MTTYQEPPLQSRRAARQEERADAPPLAHDDSAAGDSAAQLLEPLNYSTTSRPPLPQYDGQNLRPRRTVESADQGELSPSAPLPDQNAPGYRARDFSPEGRRAVAPSWAPQYGAPTAHGDGTLPVQTQSRDQVLPPVTPTGPATASAAPSTPGEHTMTRRELRALREAGLIPDDAVVSAVTGAVVPSAPEQPGQPESVAPVVAAPAALTAPASPLSYKQMTQATHYNFEM